MRRFYCLLQIIIIIINDNNDDNNKYTSSHRLKYEVHLEFYSTPKCFRLIEYY